jgi:hypothetical protein
VKLDSTGGGAVNVGPSITNMEWDIYQISVTTTRIVASCQAQILHNGFFLCATPVGSRDTATGPPDIVVRPGDDLTVQWIDGAVGDLATVGVWYNENPVGTTVSMSH